MLIQKPFSKNLKHLRKLVIFSGLIPYTIKPCHKICSREATSGGYPMNCRIFEFLYMIMRLRAMLSLITIQIQADS